MSIGDGLFLSALFLGLVALYIFTRDRWNWKKLVFRSIASVVALVAVIIAGVYAYSQYENRPRIADSLWDLRVGDSLADVKFAKGEPTQIDDSIPAKPRWFYESENVSYFVDFKDGKTIRVFAIGDSLWLPTVAGITPYNTPLEELTERLGPPSHVSNGKDGLSRAYSFAKYNVAFVVEQGKIKLVAIGVDADNPVKLSGESASAK